MSNIAIIFDTFYEIFVSLYLGGSALFYWLTTPIVEDSETEGLLDFFVGHAPIEFLFSGMVIAVLTWSLAKWIIH